MNGELMLYRIPPNRFVLARTVRELVHKMGGGKVRKLYAQGDNGTHLHVGYRVGGRTCEAFHITDRDALRNAERAHAKERRHA